MRKPIIAGNWKMHKTVNESVQFVRNVKDQLPDEGVETIICAPFTALQALADSVKESPIGVGAQNMHWEENGAFTGEISPVMLQAIGVTYVIIGHSERRQYFNETDETVNKKVLSAFQYDLTPIVCVGEDLDQREAGQARDVIGRQTEAALAGVSAEHCSRMIIAYEPVWAIGTGKSSSPEEANEQIAYIRNVVKRLYDEETAQKVRIQYGGSVKPENIKQFMNQSDIDGALVGGASLKEESFVALVEEAKERNQS